MRRALFAAAFALACAAACTDDEPARSEPARMELPAAERERGEKACRRYVERVCACAETSAELEDECELARGRPEALEMALGAAGASGDLEARDRAASLGAARRIIQACFEADARLDPATCPRR